MFYTRKAVFQPLVSCLQQYNWLKVKYLSFCWEPLKVTGQPTSAEPIMPIVCMLEPSTGCDSQKVSLCTPDGPAQTSSAAAPGSLIEVLLLPPLLV